MTWNHALPRPARLARIMCPSSTRLRHMTSRPVTR
jgi:hypothetical protein